MTAPKNSAPTKKQSAFARGKSYYLQHQYNLVYKEFEGVLATSHVNPKIDQGARRKIVQCLLGIGEFESAYLLALELTQEGEESSQQDLNCLCYAAVGAGKMDGLESGICNFHDKWMLAHHSILKAGKTVICVSLPKSGSTSVCQSISDVANYPIVEFPFYSEVDALIGFSKPVHPVLQSLGGRGLVVHSHMWPDEDTFKALSLTGNFSFHLHVRNPIDSMLSALDMYLRLHPPLVKSGFPDFFHISFEEQVNWMVENYFPMQIRWLCKWIELAGKSESISISTYDQLSKGQSDTIANLALDMAEFDGEKCSVVNSPRRFGQRVFGKNRDSLSSEQLRELQSAIPESVKSFL